MRMRKEGWTTLGIVGLSLLLCAPARAQTDEVQRAGEPPTQPPLEDSRAAASPAPAGGEVELWRTVTRLQRELAQLRVEVAELRAELAEQRGVGGAGTAGQTGAVAPPPGPETSGTAVAKAVYAGTVQEVGPQAIVIADATGTLLTLDVDSNTRVLRNGRRIPMRQLQPGTRVQASVDLLSDGRNEAVELIVQPAR